MNILKKHLFIVLTCLLTCQVARAVDSTNLTVPTMVPSKFTAKVPITGTVFSANSSNLMPTYASQAIQVPRNGTYSIHLYVPVIKGNHPGGDNPWITVQVFVDFHGNGGTFSGTPVALYCTSNTGCGTEETATQFSFCLQARWATYYASCDGTTTMSANQTITALYYEAYSTVWSDLLSDGMLYVNEL